MSTLQHSVDALKPSLFELLSEQQLSALIPPSLRYLLTVATHRHPRYLLRILNSFDELLALLMLLVEGYFLRTHGGSFTENFYGLKRERVPHLRNGELTRARAAAPELMRETLKLSRSDIWRNLALLVGLPYVKRKLDEGFEVYGATHTAVVRMGPNYRRDDLPPNPSIKQRLLWYYKWFLRKIYPSMNAAYHFSLLAFSLAYLFDNTRYSSPMLWLLGTRIRRLNEADYRAIALATNNSPSQQSPRIDSRHVVSGRRPGLSLFHPSNIATTILPQFLSGLKILLPTSIFALKFLEWWHASDFARQLSKKATESLDLPPPVISGLPPTTSGNETEKLEHGKRGLPSSQNFSSSAATNTVALSGTSDSATESDTQASSGSTAPTSTDSIRVTASTSRPMIPTSSLTSLPIFTVPAPSPATSALCPICRHPIQTPTSAQTGYVFCYTCIFKWVDGRHERQVAFMEGNGVSEGWGEEDDFERSKDSAVESKQKNRDGVWESGKGRCAVTGRRVLGGTDGLRRVMV